MNKFYNQFSETFLQLLLGLILLSGHSAVAQVPRWGDPVQIERGDYDAISTYRVLSLDTLSYPMRTTNPSSLTEDQIVGTTNHTPLKFYQIPTGGVMATWDVPSYDNSPPYSGPYAHAYVRFWNGTTWSSPQLMDNGSSAVDWDHYIGGMKFYQVPSGSVMAAWDLAGYDWASPYLGPYAHAYVRFWNGSSWSSPQLIDNGASLNEMNHYASGMKFYLVPGGLVMAAWDLAGYDWAAPILGPFALAFTRFWDGTAWSSPQRVDNGNYFVEQPTYKGGILYRQDPATNILAIWFLQSSGVVTYYKRSLFIPPEKPVLLTPSYGSVLYTLRPTFEWSDAARATSYQIQVSTSSGFTNLVINQTTTSSTYTSTIDLSAGSYYWRVWASNLAGNSDWTDPWNFTILLNNPPIARAGGPYTGYEDVPVTFDGSASSDPDGDPLTFSWDFGDGTTGTGLKPVHTYSIADTFSVTLTVYDGMGGSNTDRTTALIFVRVFVDVSTSAGVGGADVSGLTFAWGDYNNDGNLDLYVSTNSLLYRNNGNGTFTETAIAAGVTEKSRGGYWGDYDNDGDLDLYLVRYDQPNLLFRNNGNGTFTEIGAQAGVADSASSMCAAWGDYDNDGKLDFYVVNHVYFNRLYHNNGDGTFTNVASQAGVADVQYAYSNFAAWGDYNNDSALDLYVTNGGGTPNRLYRNNGDGNFTEVGAAAGVTDPPLTGYGHGIAWGDYDNDGDLDLFVAKISGQCRLYRNNGDGTFAEVGTQAGVADATDAWGVAWGDYDNDGFLDLYLATLNSPVGLYRNNGNGTFTDVAASTGLKIEPGENGAWGDYDNDGDLDLIQARLAARNNIQLFQNQGSSNHWLVIKTIGTVSNRDGIGTRVRVVAKIPGRGQISQIREVEGGSGMGCQNSLPVEFGLGQTTIVDSIIIRWPSGRVQVLTNVSVNQYVTITEPGPSGSREITADANTVLLEHFNGTTLANNIYPAGLLAFVASLPGLNQALDCMSRPTTLRYDLPAWYQSNLQGASPTPQGSVEEWILIQNRNLQNIFLFQWYKADFPPGFGGWIGLLRITTEGKLRWEPWGSVGASIDHLDGNTVIPLNQWTHVALTWGPRGTKLYINGIVDASTTDNLYPAMGWDGAPEVYVYLGGDSGYLEEVHVSKIQRSDEEIRAHYQLVTAVRAPVHAALPSAYLLEQNYPNPFNAGTVIRYQLPKASHVTLRIFNALGQEIRRLVDAEQAAGFYTVHWDGKNDAGLAVASGIYLVRMEAGGFVEMRKVLLMR